MGLKALSLKPAYYSDEDNLLKDFYIPVLSKATKYDRIAGFFCSNSLALAAVGISELIKKGGKIRLIANVVLSEQDQEAIREAIIQKEQEVLEDIERIEDELKRNHIRMLGWMIKNNHLEIKIAVVRKGLEHQKLGILYDDAGAIVSFSGSENETVYGWLHNDEQFHVFCSWIEGDKNHLNPEIERFDVLWADKGRRVRVFSVSEAFNRGLIKNAPRSEEEFNNLSYEAVQSLLAEILQCREEQACYKVKKYSLRPYQEEARAKWVVNGFKGIFEMATGTGKTFTALSCLELLKDELLATIITAPFQHLVKQWEKELSNFNISADLILIADSSTNWKDRLVNSLIDANLGYFKKIIILTTHDTFSSQDFLNIVKTYKKKLKYCLIADEVHGIGSSKRKNGLIDEYDYRIGLSATPSRWFDEDGTQTILEYFSGIVFEYGLKEALTNINPVTGETYLVPYEYIPIFAHLNDSEMDNYVAITAAIIRKYNSANKSDDENSILDYLIFERANIIKNAASKYDELESLLKKTAKDLNLTIIYCTPEQLEKISSLLKKLHIIYHKFTMDEGTYPDARFNGLTEREYILNNFSKKKYSVLLAMKCLDEGVDIPPAKTGIIVASSGNPREYIQRIGRLVRRYPGKTSARIYDFITIPKTDYLPSELKNLEIKILKKEFLRCEEVAKYGSNNSEALRILYSVKRKLMGG